MGTMGEVMASYMDQVNKVKPVLKQMISEPARKAAKKIVTGHICKKIMSEDVMPYEPESFPWGLNLIGPLESATGLGQSFRLVERIVSSIDIPYLINNYAQDTRNKICVEEYEEKIRNELCYGVNLWHINPSEFAQAYARRGKRSFDRRYNIAFWLWELEEFPDEWVSYIHLLDEIWTPSEFISRGIRKKTQKPVYTIPYCVTADTDVSRYGRKYFHLPEKRFLFLMMYDVQSIRERKNPEGVIKAFRKAFASEQSDVGLVIKVNSADAKELCRIRQQTGNYENIYYICDNLEKIQVNSLIASVDVFVSLHRAEGFGLVLAEAMLNHIPTIATNWSANTEFMNEETACMVSCQLKTLEKDVLPYRKGNEWAEPNIEEAAEYMNKLFYDRVYYNLVSDNAYRHIQNRLGLDRIKKLTEERFQSIRNGE